MVYVSSVGNFVGTYEVLDSVEVDPAPYLSENYVLIEYKKMFYVSIKNNIDYNNIVHDHMMEKKLEIP